MRHSFTAALVASTALPPSAKAEAGAGGLPLKSRCGNRHHSAGRRLLPGRHMSTTANRQPLTLCQRGLARYECLDATGKDIKGSFQNNRKDKSLRTTWLSAWYERHMR